MKRYYFKTEDETYYCHMSEYKLVYTTKIIDQAFWLDGSKFTSEEAKVFCKALNQWYEGEFSVWLQDYIFEKVE